MIAISGVDKVDFNQYDEVWYITNTTPNMKIGAKHHKELAPPEGVFWQYKRNSIPLDTLLNTYGNMLWSGSYKAAIDALISLSDSGKWIQLVCYCPNYLTCHRYVLYKYLSTLTDKVVLLDAA